MVNEQYTRAKNILMEHKEGHNALAELLIQKEVIMAEDVERIFGKRPWLSRSQEIMEDEQPKVQDDTQDVDDDKVKNIPAVQAAIQEHEAKDANADQQTSSDKGKTDNKEKTAESDDKEKDNDEKK